MLRHRAREPLPPGDLLTVRTVEHDGVPRLVVHGELDVATAPLLAAMIRHVREAGAAVVHVELGHGTFADSAGLEPVLVDGVRLTSAPPAVWRLVALLSAAFEPGTASGRRPSGDRAGVR